MPTRTAPQDGSAGSRANLFAIRGHLIGQVPLWRVTPFLLIGGGGLGTTGALGKDVDPELHLGGGVKSHVSRLVTLRIDFRDTMATWRGTDPGIAHYPELIFGVSLALNRRARQQPRPSSALEPARGKAVRP